MMNINKSLLPEFDQEMKTTLRVFNELSDYFFDFRPHEKSWTTKELANHIAKIPTWVNGTLDHPELDFATAEIPQTIISNKADLVALFNKNVENARQSIGDASDEHMMENWTLRQGEKVFFTLPRIAVLRSMVMSHIIHHRAQLGMHLRLNNAKVPASYGDSADEKNLYD